MKGRSEQLATTLQRGDTAKVVRLSGHRVAMSARESAGGSSTGSGSRAAASKGFTLIELVISITVMTILTLGVVPLVKVAVKRQKEQQLREALRAMRSAVDEFHRDTVGLSCSVVGTPPPGPADPRSKVMISDCTIFGVDNPDRYPPDLETLANGVNVLPRMLTTTPGLKPLPTETSTKKKVYLRGIPVDPITGKAEWDFRSCYDAADSDSWGGENLFDVRSKSKETALNGEKYSDW